MAIPWATPTLELLLQNIELSYAKGWEWGFSGIPSTVRVKTASATVLVDFKGNDRELFLIRELLVSFGAFPGAVFDYRIKRRMSDLLTYR